MRLCYIDDSGDSRYGTLLTALVVDEHQWRHVLGHWMEGRRAIAAEFGVPVTKELHANELYKGRGRYCEDPVREMSLGKGGRGAVGRIMLSHLARAEFTAITIGSHERVTAAAYARTLHWLDGWATAQDTHLLVFYDGQEGATRPDASADERAHEWDIALRAAAPYRQAHRGLRLSTRRIIEDVVMQDSRYSQLIQAADLVAYGAYHKHLQDHPKSWHPGARPCIPAIRAYAQLRNHWISGCGAEAHGVVWLD